MTLFSAPEPHIVFALEVVKVNDVLCTNSDSQLWFKVEQKRRDKVQLRTYHNPAVAYVQWVGRLDVETKFRRVR